MSKLRAIRNHILFQFEEDYVYHMGAKQFKSTTDWGFEIVRSDESTQEARWVRIVSVGPEADEDLKPGMRVLVEPLKWTRGVTFEGEEYSRTDSDCILLIDESVPAAA